MKEFFKGIGHSLGVGIGYLPIAMSFGALASQAGLSSYATLSMSVWVYAGASQFAAVNGIQQGLSWTAIVGMMLLMNLRHIPMSLSMRRLFFKEFNWGKQLLLYHGLTDEAFALDHSETIKSWIYYAGIHLFCWLCWIFGSGLGFHYGAYIPERWLRFALPCLFLCLLTDGIRGHLNPSLGIALAAGTLLTLFMHGFGSIGMLITILAVAIIMSFSMRVAKQEKVLS